MIHTKHGTYALMCILTHTHMHKSVLGHQCVAIFCADCFVLLSFNLGLLVWSVCTALTLVISCECPLFTVGEGACGSS